MFIDKMDLPKTEMKQVVSGPIVKSRKPEDILECNQIMGIDKNLLIMAAILSLSVGISFYLFKEIKKVKEDFRTLKSGEADDDLIEKVEQNSESVKAIENKLDQLISALSARDRAMNEARKQAMTSQMPVQMAPQQQMPVQMQMAPQQMPVQMQMAPQQQMPVQMQQQQMQHQEEYQNQNQNQRENEIPVMGGRLGGSANPDIILM